MEQKRRFRFLLVAFLFGLGCPQSPIAFQCPPNTELHSEAQGQIRWCQKKNAQGFHEIEGPELRLFANGRPQFQAFYKNGKEDGKRTLWYPGGRKKMVEEDWLAGVKMQSIRWYENGRVKEKTATASVEHDGYRIVWDDRGQKVKEEAYPYAPPLSKNRYAAAPAVYPFIFYCRQDSRPADGAFSYLDLQVKSGGFGLFSKIITAGFGAPIHTQETMVAKDLECERPANQEDFWMACGSATTRLCVKVSETIFQLIVESPETRKISNNAVAFFYFNRNSCSLLQDYRPASAENKNHIPNCKQFWNKAGLSK